MREVVVRKASVFDFLVIERNVFYLRKTDELGIGGRQVHYADPSGFARTLSAIRNLTVKPVVFGSPKLIASFIRYDVDFDLVTTRDISKHIYLFDSLAEAIAKFPNRQVVAFSDSVIGYTKLKTFSNVKFYSYVPPTVDSILFMTLDSKLTEKTLTSYILSPVDVVIVYEKLSSHSIVESNSSENNLSILFD